MSKERSRINIEKSQDKYNEIKKHEFFSNMGNKELFFYVLSIGFANDLRIPLKSSEALFTVLDMRNDHYSYALLYAVALFETKDHEVLSDMNTVYRIAEEFANGGYSLLLGQLSQSQFGEFTKLLEKEVHDGIEKINEELQKL